MTLQSLQILLACSIWSTAGPVFPTGKNSSGSSVRQRASVSHGSSIYLCSLESNKNGHRIEQIITDFLICSRRRLDLYFHIEAVL